MLSWLVSVAAEPLLTILLLALSVSATVPPVSVTLPSISSVVVAPAESRLTVPPVTVMPNSSTVPPSRAVTAPSLATLLCISRVPPARAVAPRPARGGGEEVGAGPPLLRPPPGFARRPPPTLLGDGARFEDQLAGRGERGNARLVQRRLMGAADRPRPAADAVVVGQ